MLRRLVERGRLTAQQGAEAAEETPPAVRAAMPFVAVHLADRLARGAPGGGVIPTHIDRALQEAIEAAARREARWFDDGATIAAIVVENAGRRVRAYLGGTDFFAPAGQVDLARALRSPGSSLKPFIYGLGFDDLAIHPETLIDDKPARFGDYAPQNFDRDFRGTLTVRQALQQSLNLPAIALLDRIGPQRFAATLRDAGLTLAFPQPDQVASLPLALGGVGTTLSDLATGYAALADRGRVLPLALARGVPEAASSGRPTTPDTAPPGRLMSPEAAAQITRILAASPLPDALVSGSIARTGRWIAFKTGTSYGFRDAWAVGYSARHTVAVWVGRADGTPRPGALARATAAPLLFKFFDLLPPGDDEPLPGVIDDAVSTVALPAGLRRFTGGGCLSAGRRDRRAAARFDRPASDLGPHRGRRGAAVPLGDQRPAARRRPVAPDRVLGP